MGHDIRHGYDSFVVRIWHDSAGTTVHRTEVQHVQSGTVEVGVGATWDWIRDWLQARMTAAREAGRGPLGDEASGERT